MKNCKKFFSLLLVLIFVFFAGCTGNPNENTDDVNEKISFLGEEFPMTLSTGIKIEKAFLYTGEFPEDGSFSKKNNVFALKVKNQTGKDIQLVRINVATDENEYLFEITTLPSDKTVTVLEKNAQTVSEKEKIIEIKEENMVFFENRISLATDKVQITPLDKVLNIKNISNDDITSDAYVYFKRVDGDGNYFGGITFRSNAGTLKAGEFKQIPASHFIKDNSEVLFVDYGKQ